MQINKTYGSFRNLQSQIFSWNKVSFERHSSSVDLDRYCHLKSSPTKSFQVHASPTPKLLQKLQNVPRPEMTLKRLETYNKYSYKDLYHSQDGKTMIYYLLFVCPQTEHRMKMWKKFGNMRTHLSLEPLPPPLQGCKPNQIKFNFKRHFHVLSLISGYGNENYCYGLFLTDFRL